MEPFGALFYNFFIFEKNIFMQQQRYTLKKVTAFTDSNGGFQITPLTDEGYNILQWGQYDGNDQHPRIAEYMPNPSDNTTNQNTVFEQLVGYYSRSLDEIANSPDSRIFGTRRFVAYDGGGAVVSNAEIKLMVVVWHY